MRLSREAAPSSPASGKTPGALNTGLPPAEWLDRSVIKPLHYPALAHGIDDRLLNPGRLRVPGFKCPVQARHRTGEWSSSMQILWLDEKLPHLWERSSNPRP